jgi:large subunit ribosomal protein L10e
MAMRKARAYSKKKVLPYTRFSRKKEKAFVRAVPAALIVKFNMGNREQYEMGKLPHVLSLVTTENIQLRQNAMEACRQFINKKLDTQLPGQYYFRVIPVPHHIQRENKMLTGAGADRMQTGMQLSFGKTIARAALLKAGEPIMSVALPNARAVSLVRGFYRQIRSKLPCKTRAVYKEIKD